MNTARRAKVLLCSVPGDSADLIIAGIKGAGIDCETYPTIDKALTRLESGSFDAFILRVSSDDEDIQQIDKLSIIHKIDADLPVVVVSEIDSIGLERAARLQDVFYYLVEPLNMDELKQVLTQSFIPRRRRAERRTG